LICISKRWQWLDDRLLPAAQSHSQALERIGVFNLLEDARGERAEDIIMQEV